VPNFNFKSQFPIADVIAAAQKKPLMEAQIAQTQEQMRSERLKTLLDALSTGAQVSRLTSQNKNEALARQQTKSQMAGQSDLQSILAEPAAQAPVAPSIPQFGAPAVGPVPNFGVPQPTGAVAQPTFGDTAQGGTQNARLNAALIKGFPDQAGKAMAERTFADPLDREFKKAQIANVGVDNQLSAARLLEEKRKNDHGIALDEAKLGIDRDKLGIEREKLKIEAANAGTKLTDVQANALLFGERAAQSNKELEDSIAAGFDPTSFGTTLKRWVPNRLQGEQVQLLEQSQLNFVSAVLRKESGAAISKDEWKTAKAQYFPADGDSEKVLAQKKKNREIAIGGLLRQGGKQGQEIISRYRQSAAPAGGGVPAVGSTFNGGKVLSVEKVAG
jgi:hypothetical protein